MSPKPAAAPAKNIAPLQTANVEDPTLLLIVLGHIVPVPVDVDVRPEIQPKPANLIPQTAIVSADPSAESNVRPVPERLNLAEFGVTRFEYKTETEPHPPVLQSVQLLQMVRPAILVREIKPLKPVSDFDSLPLDASSESSPSNRPIPLSRPDEIQRVRPVFEPSPPPPVVRSVSMDIGDPESQVRVVIRERNGSLNVQIGSANERLREDLQVAGPMLMRELQRNNPMTVTLDFSNFGSATEADSQSRPQSRAKKFLKFDAEFADVVETAYRPAPASQVKPL